MSTYVVKAGDNLSAIGAKFGVDYKQITGYKSGNPGLIYAGETLNIPDKPGSTPAMSPTPAPAPVPTYQPTVSKPTSVSSPTPTGGSGGTTPEGIPLSSLPADLLYGGQLDVSNPDKQTKYNQIVQQYKGSQATGGGTGIGGGAFLNTPTIDLPGIYQGLYKNAGIADLESKLSDQTKSFNDAQSKINDNPYLSEANRVGRIQKLQTDFNNDSAGTRNDIATKKADVETALNIQTKQFDINSQQATQSLSQFNTLLASGALSNASGEDIAAITKATGMSSSMIQSAIKAQTAKNAPPTQTIQFDDGTNQGFAIINSQTGEIISKQVVAGSTPTAAQKNASSGTSANTAPKKADVTKAAGEAASNGKTYEDMLAFFVQYGLSPTDIYKIYTATNYYGRPPDNVDPKTGLYKSQ